MNIEILKTQYHECSDYQLKFRLLQILHYAMGKSGTEIAEILFISHDQVYYWIHRYIENGIEGLYDRERPGRPNKIDYEKLSEVLASSPSSIGIDQETWDIDSIYYYIKHYQEVDISKRYTYEILDRIGYDVSSSKELVDESTYPDLRTREGRILTSLHIEVMGDAEVLLDAPIHKIITDSGIRPVFSIVNSSSKSTTIQGETENGLLTIKYEEFLDDKKSR